MPKRFLIWMVLPFWAVACGGATSPSAPDATPTTAPAPTPTEGTASAGFSSECTLVSSLNDAPPEFETLFEVTDDDWVDGLDTAALTIVEYSDFQ